MERSLGAIESYLTIKRPNQALQRTGKKPPAADLVVMINMKSDYDHKSKKTPYGGIEYRSILEARWAVFFDLLSITHTYEKEYSDVEAGCRVIWYKPDFHLPELNKYIEIKPRRPKDDELTKAAGWSEDRGDIVILFELNPPKENTESGWLFTLDSSLRNPTLKATLFKSIWWCECPKCGKIDLCQNGEIECGCCSTEELTYINSQEEEKGFRSYPKFEHTQRLLTAYKVAKHYNFKNKKKAEPILYNSTIWQSGS